MRIALDSLTTYAAMLQRLMRDMAAALDEERVEIDRLRLIIKQFQCAYPRVSPTGCKSGF